MNKKLLSKRDISVNLYVLDNGHGALEGILSDTGHLIQLEMEIDPVTGYIERSNCRIVIGPFPVCRVAEELAAGLAGLTIGRGILKQVSGRLGGEEGCVHLRELAYAVITFAANSMLGMGEGFSLVLPSFARKDPETRHAATEKYLKGTCLAYGKPFGEHKALIEMYKKKTGEL